MNQSNFQKTERFHLAPTDETIPSRATDYAVSWRAPDLCPLSCCPANTSGVAVFQTARPRAKGLFCASLSCRPRTHVEGLLVCRGTGRNALSSETWWDFIRLISGSMFWTDRSCSTMRYYEITDSESIQNLA